MVGKSNGFPFQRHWKLVWRPEQAIPPWWMSISQCAYWDRCKESIDHHIRMLRKVILAFTYCPKTNNPKVDFGRMCICDNCLTNSRTARGAMNHMCRHRRDSRQMQHEGDIPDPRAICTEIIVASTPSLLTEAIMEIIEAKADIITVMITATDDLATRFRMRNLLHLPDRILRGQGPAPNSVAVLLLTSVGAINDHGDPREDRTRPGSTVPLAMRRIHRPCMPGSHQDARPVN